jgi:hypothetical protein
MQEFLQLKEDGTVEREITTDENVLWGPNHFQPARTLTEEERAMFRVVPLLGVAPPEPAQYQSVERAGAESVNGEWRYKWAVRDWSAQEIAQALDAAKAAKNAEINEARATANRTSFAYAGKAIACDALSRGDIDGTNGYIALYGAMPPGFPGGWKAIDNTYVAIPDVDTWKAFYTAMFAQGAANFAKSQTLKAALAAAATTSEVAAINW